MTTKPLDFYDFLVTVDQYGSLEQVRATVEANRDRWVQEQSGRMRGRACDAILSGLANSKDMEMVRKIATPSSEYLAAHKRARRK